MPAVHCPNCNSLNLKLHCELHHEGAMQPSPTCDLLECGDCHVIWCPKHPKWESAPTIKKETA